MSQVHIHMYLCVCVYVRVRVYTVYCMRMFDCFIKIIVVHKTHHYRTVCHFWYRLLYDPQKFGVLFFIYISDFLFKINEAIFVNLLQCYNLLNKSKKLFFIKKFG